jgi:hypothetical protein
MVEGLWFGVLGGSIAGLVTAIGAHAILAGPLVRVKVRDDATWDAKHWIVARLLTCEGQQRPWEARHR